MLTPSSQRPQAFPYQMDALDCLQNSPPLPKALRDVVETVVRVVLVPFALLADLVINAARLVGNIFFSVSNWTEDPPSIPSVPIIPIVSQAVVDPPSIPPVPSIAIVSQAVVDQPPMQPVTPPSPLEEQVFELEPSATRTSVSGSEEVIPPSATTPSQNSPRNQASVTIASPQSVQKATVPPSQAVHNQELPPCGDDERGLIAELITTIGKTAAPLLLGKGIRLMEIGNAIQQIHPLTFLTVAVSTKELKKNLIAILNDSWPNVKSDSFLNRKNGTPPLSLTDKLTKGTDNKSFNLYWADFAQKTKIQPQTLQKFVQAKDWAGLIKHLCSIQG